MTLIILDNGGMDPGASNFPKRGYKWSLHEGGIKNLAFVSGPVLPRKQSGRVSRELIHCTDWFPTLVHVAGGFTHGMGLYGRNQWQTIRCIFVPFVKHVVAMPGLVIS